MIRVTLFRKDGAYTGYTCSGHAGFAEEGSDIICSAVSVLAINTANSLEAFTGDRIQVQEAEDGGFLSVNLEQPISDEAQLLLRSLALGLKTIEDTYGRDYIRVKEQTRPD
jgi:uncharacterized protein YsxB (DUF464 family)